MHLLYIFALFLPATQACVYYGYGVSQAEQNAIVNKHNEVRKLIANGKVPGQPRGVNLKRMKWDKNLATAAQNIANTCVYAHKKVTDSRWAVGQNLAQSSSTAYNKGTDWTGIVQLWFDEYKKYKYPGGFSMATGHYTQVVWDNTEYVGCGYNYYKSSNNDREYHKLYVCNYGPAGNYPRAPYKTGNSGCENLC